MDYGILYMVPSPIADGRAALGDVLTHRVKEVLSRVDYFVAEDLRTARRFLSSAKLGRNIASLHFSELNEHTRGEEVEKLAEPLMAGHDMAMISEAGLPGIADPGAELASLCHGKGIRVVPLGGPSSIFMALMASGLNGQSFAFVGYLPVKPADRSKAIRRLEQRAASENQSQIFIETPYRNLKIFEDLLSNCRPATRLTVACDISGEGETIRTKTISEWKKSGVPDIHKKPAVFILL
ncbi:MAG: SAM-dependent methyltransferase [Rikenellaceae bacterium]|nr:SAM-dependent methyltransferase [Rikenellaceae bacterium]